MKKMDHLGGKQILCKDTTWENIFFKFIKACQVFCAYVKDIIYITLVKYLPSQYIYIG